MERISIVIGSIQNRNPYFFKAPNYKIKKLTLLFSQIGSR